MENNRMKIRLVMEVTVSTYDTEDDQDALNTVTDCFRYAGMGDVLDKKRNPTVESCVGTAQVTLESSE